MLSSPFKAASPRLSDFMSSRPHLSRILLLLAAGTGMAIQTEQVLQLKRKRDSTVDEEATFCFTVHREHHDGTVRFKAYHEHPRTAVAAEATNHSLTVLNDNAQSVTDGALNKPQHLLVKPIQLQYYLCDVVSLDEFKIVFLHLFNCHRIVYIEAGSLRQDLHMTNLLFMHEDGGAPSGLLHDWDLAKAYATNEMPQQNGHYCTGTAPFMVLSLLQTNPPRHKDWHDLESFIYILFWCATHLNLDETKAPTILFTFTENSKKKW
ncbi:hypothetical protein EWM64_g2512 [Hericium alpestre]|uniref:Fungal-type protein kinase domain-containing protein n=1 Tax=Hericium alpestre TaxID=135208 RepID=A0A4Z0A3A1_9AGAM|nr:hypothetical protein EWM64_g2512 [Hericium alpestre]